MRLDPLPEFNDKLADALDAFKREKQAWVKRGAMIVRMPHSISPGEDAIDDVFTPICHRSMGDVLDATVIEQYAMKAALEAYNG